MRRFFCDAADWGGDRVSDYEQRRDEALLFRLGGSPARSAAAWLSAINRAERDGLPCPDWGELERIAPSLPLEPIASEFVAERPLGHRSSRYTSHASRDPRRSTGSRGET